MTNYRLRVQELSEELARVKIEHAAAVAQRNQAEKLLKDLIREQKKLTAHFMAIREDERKFVAREIHEELGQMLASLQLNVSLMTLEYPDHAKVLIRAGKMEQLISASIAVAQRISSNLRPVMLDQLGLADAMEWQIQEFKMTAGVSCKAIILLLKKDIDIDIATAVYRILQEALDNVRKHSGAASVQVNLEEKRGWLTLSVRDDGRGIVEIEKTGLQPRGIVRMREWATVFGGKLRICGAPQRGTALFARIPVSFKGE